MAGKKDENRAERDAEFWLDVMLDYVAKNKTLAEIARARKISYSTLVKRAEREGWAAERARYWQSVVKKSTNRLSSEQARHYRSLLSANDRLAKSLDRALANGEEYIFNAGTDKEAVGKQINTSFLRDVKELIKETMKVADGLLGIMSVQEVEDREIERAKVAKSNDADAEVEEASIEISAPAAYKA